MAFHTRGLSWLTPNVAAIVRDFRDTSERLGFKGAVNPATWAEIEREHIRASAALCHLLADYGRRTKTADPGRAQTSRVSRVRRRAKKRT